MVHTCQFVFLKVLPNTKTIYVYSLFSVPKGNCPQKYSFGEVFIAFIQMEKELLTTQTFIYLSKDTIVLQTSLLDFLCKFKTHSQNRILYK